MVAKRQPVIVGTAFSDVVRRSTVLAGTLAIQACSAAIADAGLTVDDIDGISTYSQPSRPFTDTVIDGIDIVGADYLPQALKLNNLRWSCVVDRGTITAAVVEAAHAVAAGACNCVLIWRSMVNPSGPYGRIVRTTAMGEAQFTAPWGFGHAVAMSALPYSRYMATFGATREHMATFIVRNRAMAAENPSAVFYGQPITHDDYMNARMIAEPLSILDCDMPVDGSGALIVTTAERASTAPYRPAWITGTASLGLPPKRSLVQTLENLETSAGRLAASLWESSGLRPNDITCAQIYDGYSFFVYLYLEAFGLFPRGQAFLALQDDSTARGGRLPINTGGGALGMGRLHGTPQLIEAVRQIQGRGGTRQVSDPSVSLVCTGAPVRGCAALTLTQDPTT